jgi:release factor glutamine methyltransferase
MTLKEARLWIQQELVPAYAPEEASILAQQILTWALNLPFSQLITTSDNQLSDTDHRRIAQVIKEHLRDHKPLQYCFGTVPFLGTTLMVRPPVLIPRPETEWWVDLIIQALKRAPRAPHTLLDIGTGSGCIAISLALAFPKATIYAVDIEPEALRLAQENAALARCTNIIFVLSHLYDQLPQGITFNCILSNPPYISKTEYQQLDPQVALWEDPQALKADDDGYALLSSIIMQAPQWLTHDPHFAQVPQLAVEIGAQQAKRVHALMKAAGLRSQIFTDLAQKDRLVTGEVIYEL